MKRQLKNREGFSVIEVLTLAAITSVALAGLTAIMKTGFRESLSLVLKTNAEIDARAAFRHVRRVGRTARSCEKQIVAIPPSVTPTQTALECQLDFGNPVSATLSRVRFLHTLENTLAFDKFDSISATWTRQVTYPRVAEFVVCNTAEMEAGTCSIAPGQLNAVQSDPATRSPANRYFRYQMRAVAPTGNGLTITIVWQSAFFVRNPTPFGPSIVFVR